MTPAERALLVALAEAVARGPWKLDPDVLREKIADVQHEIPQDYHKRNLDAALEAND